MSIVEIFLIAIGLSMDAFAVSITLGLSDKKPKMAKFLLPGIYFGFFQALMPFIGFYGGKYFTGEIQILDHWIAFVLLAFIGGKMIKESFEKKGEKANENTYKFTRMLLLAVSTSIDALAVGITFAFFRINIFMAIIIIGLTTFIISIAGAKIGDVFGSKFKSKAEFAGGAILVMLGIKILIEHLFFSPA